MLNAIARRKGAVTLLASVTAAIVAARLAQAFDVVNRWSATQFDGGGLQWGDPVNLRWSVVPDGKSYDRSANSQLVQFLDDGWNVAAAQRTADFTNRPWWWVINNAYAQYARVSGVSLSYVAEQNAAGVSTGMFGDIRIGGENIYGTPGGTLADNTFLDWQIIVANNGTSTALLPQRDAFMRGDLNFDGHNDYLDFKLFKTAYFVANVSASLADLVAVPEPASFTLFSGLALLYMMRRDSKWAVV